MSTKRLSKTAIEGGRRAYNKWDRGQSNREQRAAEREYLGRAQEDDEYAENRTIKNRRKVNKEFDDKLGPMYRWLRSHIGQRWDSVRAKAVKAFDSRTTAGRHILYDHMFSSVQVTPDPRVGYYHDFYVDDEGLLQLGERNRWVRRHGQRKDPNLVYKNHIELYRWTGGRKVIDYGDVQFWTREPTRFGWRLCGHRGYRETCPFKSKQVAVNRPVWNYRTKANAVTLEEVNSYDRSRAFIENGRVYTRHHEWHCFGPTDLSLAQGPKFTNEEAAFWKKLAPSSKKLITQEREDKKSKRFTKR